MPKLAAISAMSPAVGSFTAMDCFPHGPGQCRRTRRLSDRHSRESGKIQGPRAVTSPGCPILRTGRKKSSSPPPSALAHHAAIFRRRALHPAPEIVGEAVVHIDVVAGGGIDLMQDDVRLAEARLGAMAGLE